jgi:hypothetical protein
VGIGQVVLAADDMSDAHLDVVDHYSKIVERVPVGTNQDQVLDFGVVACLRAVDQIVEPRNPLRANLEPDGRRLAAFDAAKRLVQGRSRYGLLSRPLSSCARARSTILSFTVLSSPCSLGVKS